ncbi:hypothetical protein Gotur_015730, partial [Gossypium turneri]
IVQHAPHGGLSIRWGTFSPRELARFKELLEKPVGLKPGWSGTIGMSKDVVGQSEPIETRGRAKKVSRSGDLLSALEDRLREFVWDTIDSSENKLVGKNDALEAMVTALKEEINELKGELKIFKAIGNRILASKLKPQAMDVPKLKAFKGARSASEVDNFLWAMEQYFRAINIEDDVTKYVEDEAREKLRRLTQRGTVREYVRGFSELML